MSYSSEDDTSCPICTEELDITDIHFKPCACGYQLCRFCWNNIMDLNGRCPACREPYDPQNYKFTPPDEQEIAQHKSKRKKEKKKPQEKETPNVKNLANIRVIQRNLVYITNLALSIAKEEYLRKYEYFGQYGKIGKIVINKNNLYSVNSPHGPSVSAYITFVSKKDALACINAIDGFWIENRALRASFGTTKYCTYFLRNLPCNNPDCMYLHELGGEDDSFTKEEIANGKHNFHDVTHPEPQLTQEELERMALDRPTILPQRLTLPEVPNDATSEEEEESQDKDQESSLDGLVPPENSNKASVPTIQKTSQKAWKTSKIASTGPVDDSEFPSPVVLHQSQPEKSALPPTASWASSSKTKQSANNISTSSTKPTSSEGNVWGPPPGIRSSAPSLNNEPISESISHNSEQSESKGAVLSEDAFPDLREIYKQNESVLATGPQNISFSQTHVPVPPSLDDRPPGIAASQDSVQTQKSFSSENSAPRWWERQHTNASTLPSDESWDAGWRVQSDRSTNPSPYPETQNNEKGLFEEWPELTQMLEEKEFRDNEPQQSSNPTIPSNAERIPSARTISEESRNGDPQQLFRSLLPNVNVSFRQTPQNSQRTPLQAPPGLQNSQQRDKWNPMMGAGVFGSPWQMFPQEQHSNSQPSLSRPFWPQQQQQQQQQQQNFGNRQETDNSNGFAWRGHSTRQEEPAQHPFSLLSHLNQSQFGHNQQQQHQQPQQQHHQQRNEHQDTFGNTQMRKSASGMGNLFQNQFQQRNENPNNQGTGNMNGWMNSSHLRHNGQMGGPPGISHDISKPQEGNTAQYNSMPQFHRPEGSGGPGGPGGMFRPPGMNGPPPGFGNGHHMPFFHQPARNIQSSDQEATAGHRQPM